MSVCITLCKLSSNFVHGVIQTVTLWNAQFRELVTFHLAYTTQY